MVSPEFRIGVVSPELRRAELRQSTIRLRESMTVFKFSTWIRYLAGVLGWSVSLLGAYIGTVFIRAALRGMVGDPRFDAAYLVGGVLVLAAGLLFGWRTIRVFRRTVVEIGSEDGTLRFKTSLRRPAATVPWESVRAVTIGRFTFVPQGCKAIVVSMTGNTPARWQRLYMFWLPFLPGQRRAAEGVANLFLGKGLPITWKGVLPFERVGVR